MSTAFVDLIPVAGGCGTCCSLQLDAAVAAAGNRTFSATSVAHDRDGAVLLID